MFEPGNLTGEVIGDGLIHGDLTPEESTRGMALVEFYAAVYDTIENEIAQDEERLKIRKAALRAVQLNDLPEAMNKVGITEYVYEGRKLLLTQDTHSNITEANRDEAIKWIQANGHGSILAYTLIIKFGSKNEALARLFQEMLRKAFPSDDIKIIAPYTMVTLRDKVLELAKEILPGKTVEEKITMSGSALIAMIKKLRREGREVPDFVGTFEPQMAKWEKIDAVEIV